MGRRVGVADDADDRFLRLFEDLEAQASGRDLHERLGEFSDLVAGEAADHALADRLAGAVGHRIVVSTAGVRFAGRLETAAQTWVLVALDGGGEVLVSAAHIDDVRVESCSHAQPQEKLSIASPLRRWRAEQIPCAVATTSAAGGVRTVVGRLDLVAEDYVEITESSGRDSARSPVGAPGGGLLVPIPAIAYVRPEKRML
ncbi:MAG: hypothetical protein ACTHVY_03195 [Brevibacterium yomogidense]|uniref:hypothetical protein n=1 Tax=Brevibacterium sp. Mu109 TaxID=1255669 RepID=UPI000C6196B0|nr:hypothetical protein [Brevibacterium sp. Mu109]SMX85993.1 hypothetical protein BSP109_02086 [Brevibacterium sp. Mu109]